VTTQYPLLVDHTFRNGYSIMSIYMLMIFSWSQTAVPIGSTVGFPWFST